MLRLASSGKLLTCGSKPKVTQDIKEERKNGEVMNGRIGVIGHFGAGGKFCDGQTVKTKNLTDLLEGKGGFSVYRVDTAYVKTNKLRLLLETIICLIRCRHVFLMVSGNGMKFYLPFLYFVNRFTRCRIYHYIIGSSLLTLVEEDPRLIRYMNALSVNWFEYESGTDILRRKGVKNMETLVNFKLIHPVEQALEYSDTEGVFRFCMFSRVMEEKGVTQAIEAVAAINAKSGRKTVCLDIYGPVELEYRMKFEQLLSDHSDCVCYRGIADSEKSVEVLKVYYALLFPTRYAGEGVPGTVIDAFAAGLPIIASDWNANRELIEDGVQGIVYPCCRAKTLQEAIEWAVAQPDEMMRMRTAARAEYKRFMPEIVLDAIRGKMEEK